MILNDTTNVLENAGMTETKTFGMQQTRESFQILSKLYSDTPLAIVRELGCNAKDSHVFAGTPDKAFHIHLPNDLEPWLTIQDFGTGIEHKDVYEIYAVYFCSTKRQNNSAVGCLGLGSKSPFAYTDNFSVTSIIGGAKRVYNAYFNEHNIPTVSMMSSEQSTEANGIAIQIPIKKIDFNKFADAIKKAFRFFDIKPTISGGKIDWKEEIATFEGTDWKTYDGLGYGISYAIMGGVTYPIESHHVNAEHYQFLTKSGLVAFFDMGELNFTPSREALDYSPKTIEALNKKCVSVKENFTLTYKENIANKPDILEALLAIHTLQEKFAFLGSQMVQDAATWKGLDLSSPQAYVRKIVGPTQPVQYSWANYGRSKFRQTHSFSLNKDLIWYVDDLERGSIARIKNFIKTNSDKKILVFPEIAYKNLLAAGFPDIFLKVSSLAKVTVNRSNGSSGISRVPFKVHHITEYSNYSHKDGIDSRDYDPSNPPLYYIRVKASDKEITGLSNDKFTIDYIQGVRTICKFFGIKPNQVVLVGVMGEKVLVNDGVESLKSAIDDIDAEISADNLATYKTYNIADYIEFSKLPRFKSLSNKNEFKVFVTEMLSNQKEVDYFLALRDIYKAPKVAGTYLKLVSENKFHHMILEKLGRSNWESKDILDILHEFDKKDLTIQQSSGII